MSGVTVVSGYGRGALIDLVGEKVVGGHGADGQYGAVMGGYSGTDYGFGSYPCFIFDCNGFDDKVKGGYAEVVVAAAGISSPDFSIVRPVMKRLLILLITHRWQQSISPKSGEKRPNHPFLLVKLSL